jgi:hypothetical protein
MADEIVYMTHADLLDLQWKADNGDQPDSLHRGERIIGWSMWKTTDSQTGGVWRGDRAGGPYAAGTGGRARKVGGMPENIGGPLLLGLVVGILTFCVSLWRLRTSRTVRTGRISARTAVFAEMGIVLLVVGIGGLLAIAGGALQPSRQLSFIIIATLAGAIVLILYSVVLTLIFVAVSRRQRQGQE